MSLRIDTILNDYFTTYGFATHQIDSFNHFIRVRLNRAINNHPHIQYEKDGKRYLITFYNPRVETPTIVENEVARPLYPLEARLKEMNYEGAVLVNIKQQVYNIKDDFSLESETLFENVKIADIPIMLRSSCCNLHFLNKRQIIEKGECKYDQGGYFIINGKERILVSQERQKWNSVIIVKGKPISPKYAWACSMNCIPPGSTRASKVSIELNKEFSFSVKISMMKKNILLGHLFKLFGIEPGALFDFLLSFFPPSTKEKKHLFLIKELISHIVDDSMLSGNSVSDIYRYIGKNSIHTLSNDKDAMIHGVQLIEQELLPTVKGNYKHYILGYMTQRLIETKVIFDVEGRNLEDDRDHFNNKRVEAVGTLLGDLFELSYEKFIETMEDKIKKQPNPEIVSTIARNIVVITKNIKDSINTGNWGLKGSNYIRAGVSQSLTRLTYQTMLSYLRKLTTPTSNGSKLTKMRQLHATQWGYICPAETPEGAQCGIVKNLTLLSTISIGSSEELLKNVLEKEKSVTMLYNLKETLLTTKLFLNGLWIAIVDPNGVDLLIKKLRHYRLINVLNSQTSISYKEFTNSIEIYTDSGRLLRPLIHTETYLSLKKSPNSWNDALMSGLIRYIDINEEETCLICTWLSKLNSTYDYCEIDPSLILGICASLIPFPDHNQAPRVIYQSNMGKQSLGIFASNHNLRFDTGSYIMHYPEQPLVQTKATKWMNFNSLPAGMSVIVGILTGVGCYGQEDSLVLNEASIQRGLFVSSVYRSHKAEEDREKSGISFSMICVPDKKLRDKGAPLKRNYSKLDPLTGIVKEGTVVVIDDVIIGRVTKRSQDDPGTDTSIFVKKGEEGIVDKVIVVKNGKGYKMVKVRIRGLKIPEMGDKLASRSSQKGTIAMIVKAEDMPFCSRDGMTCDIIMNPHAYPSRMTISQLMETICGKAAIIPNGGTLEISDATPFEDPNLGYRSEDEGTDRREDERDRRSEDKNVVINAERILKKYGYTKGYENMFDGITGEEFQCKIFIGPTFYQRLKHNVSDKIHARAKAGPRQQMTRAPSEGRSRNGGLRMGEMEGCALMTHGAARFLNERLFDVSDKFTVFICDGCGSMGFPSRACKMCETQQYEKVNMPYAAKLLFQELGAMGVKIRFDVKK